MAELLQRNYVPGSDHSPHIRDLILTQVQAKVKAMIWRGIPRQQLTVRKEEEEEEPAVVRETLGLGASSPQQVHDQVNWGRRQGGKWLEEQHLFMTNLMITLEGIQSFLQKMPFPVVRPTPEFTKVTSLLTTMMETISHRCLTLRLAVAHRGSSFAMAKTFLSRQPRCDVQVVRDLLAWCDLLEEEGEKKQKRKRRGGRGGQGEGGKRRKKQKREEK